MEEQPVYYEPPPEHQEHLRKLLLWLLVFFAVLFAGAVLFIVNAQRIVVHLPFEMEQRFVRPYEMFAEYFDDEPTSGEQQLLEVYVQSLTDDLAERIDVPPEYQITAHYLDSDAINAFATLGGHILVFRGLLEALPDENSLAMVLAHEIAHIKRRDPIASLGRGVAIQMIYSFVTGSRSGSVDLAAYGGNIGMTYFSRDQERAADLLGMSAIQSKYGHVAGGDTLFRVLLESRADDAPTDVPEWLSSHPDLEVRIAELERYAAQMEWRSGEPKPVPERVRAAIETLRP
jgi:predicted Zn-dependent protease